MARFAPCRSCGELVNAAVDRCPFCAGGSAGVAPPDGDSTADGTATDLPVGSAELVKAARDSATAPLPDDFFDRSARASSKIETLGWSPSTKPERRRRRYPVRVSPWHAISLASAVLFFVMLVVSAIDGTVAIGSLRIGECFTFTVSADATFDEEVTAVECSEPHHGEVIGVLETRDLPSWRDRDAAASTFIGEALEYCADRFESITGHPVQPPYDVTVVEAGLGYRCVAGQPAPNRVAQLHTGSVVDSQQ